MIVTGEAVARLVCKKIGAAYQEGAVGIGLEREGRFIAGVCYDNYRQKSIMAHIAVEGRMNKEYLYAIFHYPFMYLGVNKVICPIGQGNGKSIKLCENMGFMREATLHDVSPDGDIYLYTLERSKCRFTGEQHVERIKSASGP